jgi:hypothetical protein
MKGSVEDQGDEPGIALTQLVEELPDGLIPARAVPAEVSRRG